MCRHYHTLISDSLRRAAETVGRRFAESGETFTAYDVTRVLRACGLPNAPHREIKPVVHGLFANGQFGYDYVRTLVSVGGKEPAFVYHHYQRNPADYAPDRAPLDRCACLTPEEKALLAQTVVDSLAARTSGGGGGGKARIKALDALRRLRIPAPCLRQAGADAGDTVYVRLPEKSDGGNDDGDAQAIHVSLSPLPGARAYRVDCYHSVRITVRGQGSDGGAAEVAAYAITAGDGEVVAAPAA